MDTKEINTIVDEGFKALEGQMDGKMSKYFEKEKSAILTTIEEKGFTSKEEVETQVKAAKDELEEVILSVKKEAIKENTKGKSFNELMSDALDENKSDLSNLASKKSHNASIMLKADGDMDDANFGTGAYD